jgi:hypothetical protein
MRFKCVCTECEHEFCVQGYVEFDTNATVLREDDPGWEDACEHVKAGGDYDIAHGEYDSEPDYD